MATRPRFAERRRARRGSLERPINGRMYRGTWLLVGIPLLIAAFSVSRPQPLRAPDLPPAFETADATANAQELARDFPDRSPEGANAQGAANWAANRLRGLGLQTQTDRFHVEIPGRGGVDLQNVIARRPGQSSDAIVVMAHRDNTGTGPGANDNASGTAALLELARGYATPAAPPLPPRPNHTIVFLSTDGGQFGALGADHFSRSNPWRDRVVAVVNLDAIAGNGPAADRDRRRAITVTLGRIRPHGCHPDPGAERARAWASLRTRTADRPCVPFQPLRARTVRRPRHAGGDDHHGGHETAFAVR